MADPRASREEAHPASGATSPHITLRQAVRPVMVAYGILADERRAASALGEEAKAVVDLTEGLLRDLGLVHILTAGARDREMPDEAQSGRRERLADAYARAGLAWAEVVSGVTRLAEMLMSEGNWDAANLLAEIVDTSGEAEIAAHLRGRIVKSVAEWPRAQLRAIRPHDAMTATDIRETVMAFRSGNLNMQERSYAYASRGPYILSSVLKLALSNGLSDQADRVSTLIDQFEVHYSSFQSYGEYVCTEVIAILDMCEVER